MIVGLSPRRIARNGSTPAPGRPTIRPVGVGGVYIAPTAVFIEDAFGFVVLRGPFHLVEANDSGVEDDPCLVAINLPRTEALASGITNYGHPACSVCNERIDYKRIAAVPRTNICTECKRNREIKENERSSEYRRK
jgi:hypothetical protein